MTGAWCVPGWLLQETEVEMSVQEVYWGTMSGATPGVGGSRIGQTGVKWGHSCSRGPSQPQHALQLGAPEELSQTETGANTQAPTPHWLWAARGGVGLGRSS